jgi:cytochrome c oxidase assembly factor CtaG
MLSGLSWVWPSNYAALVLLLLLCVLYLLGVRRARLHNEGDAIKSYHVVAFFSAIIIAAVLLLTPIDTIARTQLFSVHMLQAILLITVCTPLLLLGCRDVVLRPLVALPAVRTIVRALTRPLTASLLFNLTFLIAHAPRVYNSIAGSEQLYHTLMLVIFLFSILNWWPLIGSLRELRNMSYPVQMLYAFFDGQPVDIFAFVLVFSGTPIYTHYAIPAQSGISAFADQAVGGALLLIPGLVDLVVMTPLFFRWLGQIEQRTKHDDELRQEEEEWEEEEWEENESDEVAHPINNEMQNHHSQH